MCANAKIIKQRSVLIAHRFMVDSKNSIILFFLLQNCFFFSFCFTLYKRRAAPLDWRPYKSAIQRHANIHWCRGCRCCLTVLNWVIYVDRRDGKRTATRDGDAICTHVKCILSLRFAVNTDKLVTVVRLCSFCSTQRNYTHASIIIQEEEENEKTSYDSYEYQKFPSRIFALSGCCL